MVLPPTNKSQLIDFIDRAEDYYRMQIASFNEDDAFYEGDMQSLSIEPPSGFDITIPSTARAVVDEAIDNIDPDEIRIIYPPRGMTDEAQKQADNVTRFLVNLWYFWRQRAYDIDPLRDFMKNLFKSGKAVFKVVPDYTLWPEVDEEVLDSLTEKKRKKLIQDIKNIRENNTPLVIRSISPQNIMEDPTIHARKLWLIEKYQGDISEIQNYYAGDVEEFRDTYDPYAYDIYEVWTATYMEPWSGKIHKGKHWVLVNDEVVREEDNPFDDLPFVIKYSGFGRESYTGQPEIKATGFYTVQNKSLFRAEIRRFSQFDAIMSQLAYPISILPDTLEDVEIILEPGVVNYVPDDAMEHVDKIFIKAPIPQPEYLSSLNMIQSQIERGTTQRAVRGAGVPGTDSAAQLGMITSQAKLRLDPVKRITENAMDEVNAMILSYIEHEFDAPVSVWAAEATGPSRYTIRPNQIKGRYRTKTKFMPNEEQARERKLVLANEAMSKGRMNPYDAYVYAGFDNASEMLERNFLYTVLQEPEIMRAVGKRLAEEWGFDVAAAQLETLMEMADVQAMLQQYSQQLQAQAMPPAPTANQLNSSNGGGSGGGSPAGIPGTNDAVRGAPVQTPNPIPQGDAVMQGVMQ